MEIPNLSLNSTSPVPSVEHHQSYKEEVSLSSTMCKYTIYNKECGHPEEDNVQPRGCPYFQQTGVPCDRDSRESRGRATVQFFPRNGICKRCLREASQKEEAAMKREAENMKAQNLREAQEREEELRRGEKELLEKKWKEEYEAKEQKRREMEEAKERSRADGQAKQQRLAAIRAREEAKAQALEHTRLEAEAKEQEEFDRAMRQSQAEHAEREAKLAADLREAERQSKAEVDRIAKLKEDEDFQFMMAKSRAEDLQKRQQQEAEEIARALRESAQFRAPPRNYQDEPYDLGNGQALEAKWTRTENYTLTRSSSPPPPKPVQAVHTPPPTPPAPAPKPKTSTPRSPPPLKPAPQPRETNFNLPAVGPQTYGHMYIGGRVQPIHESQKVPETPTGPAQPLSPTGPAKSVRLGGAIAPADVHIVREAKPSIPGPTAAAGFFPLKKTPGPRKGPPPPVPSKSGIVGKDPKLEAMLAGRRKWETEEDAPSPPVRTASAEARRLQKEDFDKGRKTGWKKDEE